MKSTIHSLPATAWLVFATISLFSGCAGTLEKPKVPDLITVPAPHGEPGSYTLGNYRDDLKAYDNAATPAEALRLRNKMTYGITAEIDYAFYTYETDLFLNEGNFHIGADFLQLGLAGASTVSNGARGKTILGALLSGVTGMNLSIDKNFFRQQTVQAITSSMESNRDRIKAVILQQLKQDTATYPFAAARADLIHYFFAGTLSAGLQQLGQDAATNAQTQKTNLNQVQLTNVSTAEVKSATDVNQAVAKAFAANDLSKVIVFLKAMGATIADNAGKDQVDAAYRDLGSKIITDPTLRQKYFTEAQKAGLIQ